MRSQTEMMNLILGVAKKDDHIIAVYINGSRANPNAPKDIFRDYDVVYVVTEIEPFLKNKKWINIFGERIIMQEPDKLDKMQGRNVDLSKCYGYLMQFADGNRIDLHIETLNYTLENFGSDSLTVTLLDKKGVLPKIYLSVIFIFLISFNMITYLSITKSYSLNRSEVYSAAENERTAIQDSISSKVMNASSY